MDIDSLCDIWKTRWGNAGRTVSDKHTGLISLTVEEKA